MKLRQLSPLDVTDSKIDYEFVSQVFIRFFKILFRSDKKIKMIYSNFSNKQSMGNDFLVLNFRFRNALWYKINKKRTEKRQFVFSKMDCPEIIEIVVYGFFQKKSFKMNINQMILDEAELKEVERQFSY